MKQIYLDYGYEFLFYVYRKFYNSECALTIKIRKGILASEKLDDSFNQK